MQKYKTDERGLAQVVVIVLVVVVLAAIAFAGYRVMNKGKEKVAEKVSTAATDALKQAATKCDYDDKDLCKFLTNWKENKYYKIVATDTTDGVKTTYKYDAEGTDKFHVTTTGEGAFEMITIGNTTYTKDTTDGKWWKQTFTPDEEKNFSLNDDLSFSASTSTSDTTAKTTYKKIGKEACGSLQCFKYQVSEPSDSKAADTTHYVWFDDKDYQLRRDLTTTATSTNDMSVSYEKVTISAPSPVKDVPAGQTLIPGSNEPIPTPSKADMQQLMPSYSGQ